MPDPGTRQLTEPFLDGPDGEEYEGEAWVAACDAAVPRGVPVTVVLRGRFEPIDGLFHWYGRIAADQRLADRHAAGDTVVLTTPHGSAEGRLSDVDPWGRFRIGGTGRPPF
jgi:hypothetical protein